MKTSFKKAMKCFLRSVPGILYLTHKGYLSGGGGGGGRVVLIPNKTIIQHLLHIVVCCLVFNRGVTKRMQHFVQHDTTFLQEYSKYTKFFFTVTR